MSHFRSGICESSKIVPMVDGELFVALGAMIQASADFLRRVRRDFPKFTMLYDCDFSPLDGSTIPVSDLSKLRKEYGMARICR